MALINAALERRIPIFAICRGLQELVVATGGSLHRKLCEQPELLEHREILNCRWNSNMHRRMKFRLKRGDYCLRCYLNVATFGNSYMDKGRRSLAHGCVLKLARRMA
ncbi:gamma-glutamyl-gamma-aminobutyrate hydrolase family protein [Escherichia coli]